MQRFGDDPQYIDSVLFDGVERARSIAEPIRDEVHEIMGFLRG